MKSILVGLAALVACASVLVPTAEASTPRGPDPYAEINAAIEKVRREVDAVQQCFAGERALRADHNAKKQAYLREFHGKIPPDFDQLLFRKAERARHAHEACLEQQKLLGQEFDWLMQQYSSVEPKSLNLAKQKEAIKKLTERFRAFGGKGAAAQAAPAEDEGSPAE